MRLAAAGPASRLRRAFAVGLLAAPAYLLYGAVIQHTNGFPLVAPQFDAGTVVALVAVGEAAALCLLGYRWGLRFTPGFSLVALLVWPWLYLRVPFGGTDVLIPWVLTLYVGSVELLHRRPSLLDSRAGQRGLAVGSVLFFAGITIQTLTRPYLLDASAAFWWLGLPFVAIPALGLVWVGVVAVILWRRNGLVGPTAVVGGWVLWVLASAAINLGSYPLTAVDGFGLFATPAADVRATWVIAALGIIAVASVEYTLRYRHTSTAVDAQPSD